MDKNINVTRIVEALTICRNSGYLIGSEPLNIIITKLKEAQDNINSVLSDMDSVLSSSDKEDSEKLADIDEYLAKLKDLI